MDNRNKQNDNLGVNKLGKNIRKSPLHQPNFPNPNRQQPEPQVYNINKNDFRSIVQQLTGPNSQELPNRPPQPPLPYNPPKPQSERLQRIRPPPLSPPVNRPPIPIPMPPQHVPNNGFVRPGVNNVAESPVSAYMRYLQNSMLGSGLTPIQQPPQTQSRPPGQDQPPAIPSPRGGGFPPLPSPGSQLPFPSPGFFNLSSFPLLSPGYQFPPPLSPNFALSPLPQPRTGPQPPLSPGISFPLSPSGFFFPSPTWRGQ